MTLKLTASNGKTIYTDAQVRIETGALIVTGRKPKDMADYMTVWFGRAAEQRVDEDGFEGNEGARLEYMDTPIQVETL